MTLKTPSFWYTRSAGPLQKLLEPFSYIYGRAQKCMQNAHAPPHKAAIPVICIGNLTAGGSGKTPVAIALMQLIKDSALATNPCFLTRGYGGAAKGTHLLNDSHTARQLGDEAMLLAAHAPVIVSANRAEGAKMAQQNGFDLIIMDDGLQNHSLYKDLKILVINGEMGFGNRKLLPAGPLRAPIDKSCAEIDAFIMIGEDKRHVRALLPAHTPYIEAALQPETSPPAGNKYIAFAGLGYPEKFFNTLREECALDVIKTIPFPDHHPYTKKDIKKLREEARKREAKLITTEKDKIRLPDDNADILTLPVTIRLKDPAPLLSLIKEVAK